MRKLKLCDLFKFTVLVKEKITLTLTEIVRKSLLRT